MEIKFWLNSNNFLLKLFLSLTPRGWSLGSANAVVFDQSLLEKADFRSVFNACMDLRDPRYPVFLPPVKHQKIFFHQFNSNHVFQIFYNYSPKHIQASHHTFDIKLWLLRDTHSDIDLGQKRFSSYTDN